MCAVQAGADGEYCSLGGDGSTDFLKNLQGMLQQEAGSHQRVKLVVCPDVRNWWECLRAPLQRCEES